jgi:hypothetical protein
MNKNIKVSFRLVASLLAVFALISLMACEQPVLASRKKANDQIPTTDEPAPITDKPAAEFLPLTLTYDGKNASLSPFQTMATSARSLGGYTYADITKLGKSTLNYFQWVFMDVDTDGVIYAYDDAYNTDSSVGGGLDLKAAVEPGRTYHVLLLAGNKLNDTTDPTLLASAYTRFTADANASALRFALIPVVVDVKFSSGTDGARQPGRLAKTVGLDKERAYTLEYFIGSKNTGVMDADHDALKQAINDGLWPLKLASAEVRKDSTWRYKYSELNEDDVRQTVTSYQPGVLDTVEVPLNDAYGVNLAWVKWQSGDTSWLESMNDLNKTKTTTGRGKYEFEVPRTASTGTVWFHLEYVPFAVFDNEAWAKAQRPDTASAVEERPVWVIRNGLTDDPQGDSTWISGTYAGTAGGISLGVVDPAALRPSGFYEDNNPWPVPNTNTLEKALEVLDRALGVNEGLGYGQYAIRQVVSADGALPSMKLNNVPGASDYIIGDGDGITTFGDGMTFANMGALKYPLSISITGPSTDSTGSPTDAQPTLALSEQGSMFALETLNVPVTLTITDVTIQGLASTSTISSEGKTWTTPSGQNMQIVIPPNTSNTSDVDNTSSLIYVGAGNTFEMKGSAKLTGNAGGFDIGGNQYGAGVMVHGGTLIMSGNNAVISGNATLSSGSGSGVAVYASGASKGSFIMSGDDALIANNTGAGTVYVGEDCFFEMSGRRAKLSGNFGGGVYVNSGQFTMSGSDAVISGNTATSGGGVYASGGQFTMSGSGAVISGNTASSDGGGVYASGGQFTMSGSGAVLSGNTASSDGGGVSVSGGQFTMSGSGAIISGNTASSDGGGVYLYDDGIFYMEAGEISGNSGGSLHQFRTENSTQKFANGIHGVVYVNGTPGNANDYYAVSGGDLVDKGWYDNQLVATVIKVVTDGTSGGPPGSPSGTIMVTGISLNTTSIKLSLYQVSMDLTATITPANADNLALTWTTPPDNIVITVDVDNAVVVDNKVTVKVTAIASTTGGTTTITARAGDGIESPSCLVTVLPTTNVDGTFE